MSLYASISAAEAEYTRAGCASGVRRDGRGVGDFRTMSIENSILPHVNGSSRIKIADAIDILCSVKLEVVEPSLLLPAQGFVNVSVDVSPSCNLKLEERKMADIGAHVAMQLQSLLLGASSLDLESLCIIPGKFCWAVNVDILIIQLDGDPIDAASIAMFVALSSTRIPKTELIIGESGLPEDFQVSGDLADAWTLSADHMPISVTFTKVGDVFVMDATGAEHACASCAFAISVSKHEKKKAVVESKEKGAAAEKQQKQAGVEGVETSEIKCNGMLKVHGVGTFTIDDLSRTLLEATALASSTFSNLEAFFASSSSMSVSDGLYSELPPARLGLLA